MFVYLSLQSHTNTPATLCEGGQKSLAVLRSSALVHIPRHAWGCGCRPLMATPKMTRPECFHRAAGANWRRINPLPSLRRIVRNDKWCGSAPALLHTRCQIATCTSRSLELQRRLKSRASTAAAAGETWAIKSNTVQ